MPSKPEIRNYKYARDAMYEAAERWYKRRDSIAEAAFENAALDWASKAVMKTLLEKSEKE